MPVRTTSRHSQESLPGAELWPPNASVGGRVGSGVAVCPGDTVLGTSELTKMQP